MNTLIPDSSMTALRSIIHHLMLFGTALTLASCGPKAEPKAEDKNPVVQNQASEPAKPARPIGPDDIRQRLVRILLDDFPEPRRTGAAELLARLPDDGWWPDVPWEDDTRSGWKPMNHLSRLADIAICSQSGGPLAADPAVLPALNRGIAAWRKRKPISRNWWHNEIGVPQEAVKILAARPDLEPSYRSELQAIVGYPLDHDHPETFTGQNLVWRAGVALLRAACENDEATLTRAVATIASTVTVSSDDGLQADGSFHQHGAQLMTGTYGIGWIRDIGRYFAVLDGSPWAMPVEKQRLLESATVDGIGWMIRQGRLDPACMGRSLSWESSHREPLGVAMLARRMAQNAGSQTEHWSDLAAAASGERAYSRLGSKHFWRSDASFVQRTDFSVGILAATTRTQRVESINNEHVKGALHSDGTTWIRRRGDEFTRLAPVMDWACLPGTTVIPDTPLRPKGMIIPAESRFGAGVSDASGRLAHGWDLARGELRGHQAWFAVEQGLVVLLAGMRHPTALVTCTGPIAPFAGSAVLPSGGMMTLKPGDAFLHDGLAWLSLDGAWTLKAELRTGSWADLSVNQRKDPLSVEQVSMRCELGAVPDGAACAWAVLSATDGLVPSPSYTVLANRPEVQAVRDRDGTILAVFRAASSLAGITVDGPAVLIAAPQGPQRRIIVADPTRPKADGGPRTLTISCDDQRIEVRLPQGDLAGSSVIFDLGSPSR